jgi:hypothetical protein
MYGAPTAATLVCVVGVAGDRVLAQRGDAYKEVTK